MMDDTLATDISYTVVESWGFARICIDMLWLKKYTKIIFYLIRGAEYS
jgi:hypothetical protein